MFLGQYNLTAAKLFKPNVNVGSSYLCNDTLDYKFDTPAVEHKINATLRVVDLQVQAFYDTSKVTDGTFGSGKKILKVHGTCRCILVSCSN